MVDAHFVWTRYYFALALTQLRHQTFKVFARLPTFYTPRARSFIFCLSFNLSVQVNLFFVSNQM